jgi:hypothetical protein
LRASYDTLWRYAQQELGWHKKPSTVRVDDPPPGQEAQVDFGKMGLLFDAETGRKRVLWALIVTLSFSRYQFVSPTFRQTTEAVSRGWIAPGSSSARWLSIIPDNAKGMIEQADPLQPTLVAAFLDYVQACGLFVDPARVRTPKDKPRVENQVAYARESWFDGESFAGIDDARASAEHWCRDIAGTRIHGTTRRVPREVFESVEKVTMKPPPEPLFDVPIWIDRRRCIPITTFKLHVRCTPFRARTCASTCASASAPIARSSKSTSAPSDGPEPLSVAVEPQDRRVVRHQHLVLRVAPHPRLLRMHGLECDLLAIQETIETFQLSLRPHGLGKAEPRISSQLHPNPLQSLAPPTIPERSPTVLLPDVLETH